MAGPLDNFQVVKWHDVDFSQYCRSITANLVFNVGTLLIDAMFQFVHPDVVFKNVAGSEVNAIATGFDEFRELSERAKPFYSTRHEQIINIESTGETTIVDISFEGVFAADWNGVKAGDINKVKGRSVYEFLDEKIYKITDYS